MELGLDELSPRFYFLRTPAAGTTGQSGFWSMDMVCKNFVCAKYSETIPADRFVKERISFVELAFRLREEELVTLNSELTAKLAAAEIQDQHPLVTALRVPGNRASGLKAYQASLNSQFRQNVDELNERFRRANAKVDYHNGFIQIVTDELVEEQIDGPFWAIVSGPIWKNVDSDMKEALDRRDGNDKDPAFYAARALESAIKIISDEKGWTHGGEKGAHSYLDNLGSAKNGTFIRSWEREALKQFFTEIRNPFGHGAGSAEMPELTPQQTDWAIEASMSWIKSLIHRI
jgi:hypothetical protein